MHSHYRDLFDAAKSLPSQTKPNQAKPTRAQPSQSSFKCLNLVRLAHSANHVTNQVTFFEAAVQMLPPIITTVFGCPDESALAKLPSSFHVSIRATAARRPARIQESHRRRERGEHARRTVAAEAAAAVRLQLRLWMHSVLVLVCPCQESRRKTQMTQPFASRP